MNHNHIDNSNNTSSDNTYSNDDDNSNIDNHNHNHNHNQNHNHNRNHHNLITINNINHASHSHPLIASSIVLIIIHSSYSLYRYYGKPQTPYPNPQTPNPQTPYPNPQPPTPNPQPPTPNPQPPTPNPLTQVYTTSCPPSPACSSRTPRWKKCGCVLRAKMRVGWWVCRRRCC